MGRPDTRGLDFGSVSGWGKTMGWPFSNSNKAAHFTQKMYCKEVVWYTIHTSSINLYLMPLLPTFTHMHVDSDIVSGNMDRL